MRQVLVSPATQTTTWDISITDAKSFLIYKRTNRVGDLAEPLAIPVVMGAMTVAIANASADEAFEVRLMIEQHV